MPIRLLNVGLWSTPFVAFLCLGMPPGQSDETKPAQKQQGAQVVDHPSPSLTPLKDGVHFSKEITHPYLPLSTMRYAEMLTDEETIIREVQAETRKVGGVECLVLAEKEVKAGQVKEISYNFFAQDEQGNVYYFGEDVDDYKDGKVVGHGGAWLVGRNAKEPCLFMPAHLEVGFQFKAENSPPDAEEFDEIDKIDAELTVPAGSYQQVLVIKEGDKAGQYGERKYYARGVGLISENKELNLTVVRKHSDPARIR